MYREKVAIKCVECGKEFITKSNNAKRCHLCRPQHTKKLQAVYREKNKNVKPEPKKIIVHKTLNEIMAELRAFNEKHNCDMSYGEYVAMTERGAKYGYNRT